jgi:anti-anti-sigma regulatory factor
MEHITVSFVYHSRYKIRRQNMSTLYKVLFDEKNNIVTVRVSGEATHEIHCAALDEALKVCQDNNCSKLLIDLRDLNTIKSSTMQCFSFGEAIAERSRGLCLAHVLPEGTHSREDVRFTATVEANRGVVTREFQDIDEARIWLIGQD